MGGVLTDAVSIYFAEVGPLRAHSSRAGAPVPKSIRLAAYFRCAMMIQRRGSGRGCIEGIISGGDVKAVQPTDTN
jgi:hypothetical protein